MNALDSAFREARQACRAALIPYLTAGFPDPDRYTDIACAVLDAGADALEIGIPFSDPLLDGPAIQRAQQQALDAGITPDRCLEYAAQIHARTDRPLLFMTAYNPLVARGLERFAHHAAEAGVSGLIVPDLPFEEQGELRREAEINGLHLIQLVAPTTSETRLQRVCAVAAGFVYCISVAGVTGARQSVAATAQPLVERIKACTDVPVAVGFGIAGPEQAAAVAHFADGVIVGSALVNVVAAASPAERAPAAAAFVASLRDALDAAAVSGGAV